MKQKKSIALSLCLLTYSSHVQSDTAGSVKTNASASTKGNVPEATPSTSSSDKGLRTSMSTTMQSIPSMGGTLNIGGVSDKSVAKSKKLSLGGTFTMDAVGEGSPTKSTDSIESLSKATIQLESSIEAAKNIEMAYIQLRRIESRSDDDRARHKYYDYFSHYKEDMQYLIVDRVSTLADYLRPDDKNKTIITVSQSPAEYKGIIVYIRDTEGILNGIATITFDKKTGRLIVQYSLISTNNLDDWYKNLNTIHDTFPRYLDEGALFQNKNNVHKEFLDKFKDIYNESIAKIHKFLCKMRQTFQCPMEIRCTGHGLGGAQATLLWMNMISFYGGYPYEPAVNTPKNARVSLLQIDKPIYITLETYGSPRVLSRQQAKVINVAKNNIFRFVNSAPKKSIKESNDDTVPNIPIERSDFYHVGEEIKLAVKDDQSDLLPLYEAGIIPHGISGSIAALGALKGNTQLRAIYKADTVVAMIKKGK